MGKYIRKCRGGGTGPAPAVVVAGVRTRSRSGAVASAPAPKRPRKAAPTRAEVEEAVVKGREDCSGAAGGCCYLQLRSRKLFVVAAEAAASTPAASTPAAEEEEEALPAVPLAVVTASTTSMDAVAVAAGDSRCSSTASSSVHVVALRTQRNDSAAEAQAREDYCCEESSVSDSGCGRREGREATPSSRAPGDLSDQESSKVADDDPKHRRRWRPSAPATTTVACGARMPPAEEIEEFFAGAEKAEAERFATKYNFDVVRGVPLDAGRFEWSPVASG